MATGGSWGSWGPRHCPTWVSCRALACPSAASAVTESQRQLQCYSRVCKGTRLTTKCRAGAMSAACVYFISFWKAAELEVQCVGWEGGWWNVPVAAGTCFHRKNAGKTRHAALAAVCAHSPSRCRQLLMLLSKFNVTFFSLLLFLAGLLFSLLFLLLSYSRLTIS